MLKAGCLTEIIDIQAPVSSKNEYGANSVDWKNMIHTKAQVKHNSGNRANENNEIVFNHNVTFTIRIYHKINEDMRILWKGKYYRILSIEKDFSQQKNTIITELINE